MNMTPKKILSIPAYGTGLTIGWIGLLLIIPGGLFILAGLGISWLADRLSSDDSRYYCDLTVEEYERDIEPKAQFCRDCVYGDACLRNPYDSCRDWVRYEEN